MVLVQTTLEGTRLEVERINLSLQDLKDNAQKASIAVYGITGLIGRATGSEDVREATRRLQRLIATLNLLITTWRLAEATTGPLGLILAGLGAIGTTTSILDEVGSYA